MPVAYPDPRYAKWTPREWRPPLSHQGLPVEMRQGSGVRAASRSIRRATFMYRTRLMSSIRSRRPARRGSSPARNSCRDSSPVPCPASSMCRGASRFARTISTSRWTPPSRSSATAPDLTRSGERLHRVGEPCDGDRIHPVLHEALHVEYRRGPRPVLLGHGIEPRGARPGAQQALEPIAARLVVPVLDAAALFVELVGTHRRVANENQLVVVAVFAHHLDRGDAVLAAAVVLPHALVDAVVEVEVLEVLEFGARRRKELLHLLDVIVHRTADVEKEQHLHRVVRQRDHLEVEPACVAGGRADGAVEVEDFRGAFPSKMT